MSISVGNTVVDKKYFPQGMGFLWRVKGIYRTDPFYGRPGRLKRPLVELSRIRVLHPSPNPKDTPSETGPCTVFWYLDEVMTWPGYIPPYQRRLV